MCLICCEGLWTSCQTPDTLVSAFHCKILFPSHMSIPLFFFHFKGKHAFFKACCHPARLQGWRSAAEQSSFRFHQNQLELAAGEKMMGPIGILWAEEDVSDKKRKRKAKQEATAATSTSPLFRPIRQQHKSPHVEAEATNSCGLCRRRPLWRRSEIRLIIWTSFRGNYHFSFPSHPANSLEQPARLHRRANNKQWGIASSFFSLRRLLLAALFRDVGPPNVAAFLNHIQFTLALLVEEKQKSPEALQDHEEKNWDWHWFVLINFDV